MGHGISVVQCCQEEEFLPRWNASDVDMDAEQIPDGQDAAKGHPFYYEPAPCHAEASGSLSSMRCKSGTGYKASPVRPHGGCCSSAAYYDDAACSPSPLESLSYTPVRFDEGATVDVERSQARYSKIVVHSTRARTQRRSKAWEDWLNAASAGRAITLVHGLVEAFESQATKLQQIPAMYHLDDRAASKLVILPTNGANLSPITVLIDSIQVICPATDFMLFFNQVDSMLDESEKSRAVLIQCVTEDTERKRVCFLEESEPAKERFVQALTSHWLEKRNDHSMWF